MSQYDIPTKLLCGRLALDLLVETPNRDDKDDEAVEQRFHRDVASETASISKMAVGTSSGLTSEKHESSDICTDYAMVCSATRSTQTVLLATRAH